MLDLLNQHERIARFLKRRSEEVEAEQSDSDQSTRADLIAAWKTLERGEPLTLDQSNAVCDLLRSRFAKHEHRDRPIAVDVQRLINYGLAPEGTPSALELVANRYSVSVSKVRRAWLDWQKTLQDF